MPDTLCPAGFADRLDRALVRLLPPLSRGQARRLIAAGSVFVDGRRCRVASRLVRSGSRLRIEEGPVAPAPAILPVLYEDDACIAIDKPAGMPAAPTRTAAAGTALDCLTRQLRQRDGAAARLWLVHRLDAGTSGVLLLAKTPRAAAQLAAAFRTQAVIKTYLARVAGCVAGDSGSMAQPLRSEGRRAVVAADGRPALTEWRVRHRLAHETVLELTPRTGRMHQLRVHLRTIGHPVVGDRLYDGPRAPRLMLHALSLRFPHPVTGDSVEVQAPLPPELSAPRAQPSA